MYCSLSLYLSHTLFFPPAIIIHTHTHTCTGILKFGLKGERYYKKINDAFNISLDKSPRPHVEVVASSAGNSSHLVTGHKMYSYLANNSNNKTVKNIADKTNG